MIQSSISRRKLDHSNSLSILLPTSFKLEYTCNSLINAQPFKIGYNDSLFPIPLSNLNLTNPIKYF